MRTLVQKMPHQKVLGHHDAYHWSENQPITDTLVQKMTSKRGRGEGDRKCVPLCRKCSPECLGAPRCVPLVRKAADDRHHCAENGFQAGSGMHKVATVHLKFDPNWVPLSKNEVTLRTILQPFVRKSSPKARKSRRPHVFTKRPVCSVALVSDGSQAWPISHQQLDGFSRFQPGRCMQHACNMMAMLWPTRFLKTLSPSNFFFRASTKIGMPSAYGGEAVATVSKTQLICTIPSGVMYTYASWKTRMHITLLCLRFCGCPKLERQRKHFFYSSFCKPSQARSANRLPENMSNIGTVQRKHFQRVLTSTEQEHATFQWTCTHNAYH